MSRLLDSKRLKAKVQYSCNKALVMYRPCWGEDRVFFHHDDGRLTSIPAPWTSLGAVDPFVWLAAGRAYFRVEDLIAVADLVEALNHQSLASGEQV